MIITIQMSNLRLSDQEICPRSHSQQSAEPVFKLLVISLESFSSQLLAYTTTLIPTQILRGSEESLYSGIQRLTLIISLSRSLHLCFIIYYMRTILLPLPAFESSHNGQVRWFICKNLGNRNVLYKYQLLVFVYIHSLLVDLYEFSWNLGSILYTTVENEFYPNQM